MRNHPRLETAHIVLRYIIFSFILLKIISNYDILMLFIYFCSITNVWNNISCTNMKQTNLGSVTSVIMPMPQNMAFKNTKDTNIPVKMI